VNICTRALCYALAGAAAISSAGAGDVYQSGNREGLHYNGWSGIYFGANSGYAFDAQARHGDVAADGVLIGGQFGFNWESASHLLFGLETDIEGTTINNSAHTLIQFPGGAIHPASHSIGVDGFSTDRVRAGYAMGPVLLYGTGGFAFGNVRNGFEDLTTVRFFKNSKLQIGFAAGGGVEYKFSRAWSIRAEYLYIDLSHDNATNPLGGSIATRDIELNTVRGAINFHF
jgi:outer membrane immunogenic protein